MPDPGEEPLTESREHDKYLSLLLTGSYYEKIPSKEEDMTEKEPTTVWGDEEERTCSLCGDTFIGMGNNPEPLAEFEDRCCNDCNSTKVIPARLKGLRIE